MLFVRYGGLGTYVCTYPFTIVVRRNPQPNVDLYFDPQSLRCVGFPILQSFISVLFLTILCCVTLEPGHLRKIYTHHDKLGQ